MHVNTRAGLTFASCLRSILRQDPNVIMIGEIRDLETAEIAMKAAQTGHMVLSTLHTNDSISAVARLLDLGIPEYLIASSVTGILAQRLLRKLCACHTRKASHAGIRRAPRGRRVGPIRRTASLGRRAATRCDHTGYKGRVGIYELLVIDESIRSILRGAYKPELVRAAARAAGMRRMQEDALEKLQAGVTTLGRDYSRRSDGSCRSNPDANHADMNCPPLIGFCPYCGTRRVPGSSESDNVGGSSAHVTEGVLS